MFVLKILSFVVPMNNWLLYRLITLGFSLNGIKLFEIDGTKSNPSLIVENQ